MATNSTGMPTLSTAFEADTSQFGDAVDQLAKLVDQRTDEISGHIARIQHSVDGSTESLRGFADPMRRLLSFVQVPVVSLAAALGLDEAATKVKEILDGIMGIKQLAGQTGLSTDAVQEFQFAFDASGASEQETAQTLTKLSASLADAAVNDNNLQKLFEANNLTLKDSNGKLITMSQLIAKLATLYQGADGPMQTQMNNLLGISQKIGSALAQGPAAIAQLGTDAESSGAVISSELIDQAVEFDKEWNLTTLKFKSGFRDAIVEIGSLIGGLKPQLYDVLNVGGILDTISEGFTRNFGGIARLTEEELKRAIQAAFDDKLPAEAARLQEELDRRAGRITIHPGGSGIAGAPATVLPKTDDTKDDFTTQIDRLDKHVAALDADTLAIGRNQAQVETYKAELQLLQAIERDSDDVTNAQIDTYTKLRATMSAHQALVAAGIVLNKEQAASFDLATSRVTAAATANMQAKNSYEGLQSAVKSLGDDTVEVFDNMITGAKSFSDEMLSISRNLEKQLLQALIVGEGPFAKLLGLASSSSGGVGGLFGLFAGRGGAEAAGGDSGILGQVVVDGGMHAGGGDIPAGTLGIAGERGLPELIRGPATVIPASKLGGGGQTNHFAHISVSVDGARGNMEIQSMVHAGVTSGLKAYDSVMPAKIADVMRRHF